MPLCSLLVLITMVNCRLLLWCDSHCSAAVSVQLTSPVQWEKTLQSLLEGGLQSSYELGPNKVIAGIMKRVNKAHSITNVTV